MVRWTFRQYNRFLAVAMKRESISRRQAAFLYRLMRSRFGARRTANDLRRHPRITKSFVKTVKRFSARIRRELEKLQEDEEISIGFEYE